MTGRVRVPVQKEIWRWALEVAEKDETAFLARFKQAEKWFTGELNPTFKQLEDAATFLQIPFGYMFLDKPPRHDSMQVEFRSISNKIPKISKNLRDAILAMDRRRGWMSDYRKELGWTKLAVIKQFHKKKSGRATLDAKLAKTLLNLSPDWHTGPKDLDETFRFLKEKLEDIGILVMRSGIVGNNTRRSLDTTEFRAFLLYDDVAPLIFINNNDSKAGKIFSLVHEFFHVLFEQEDVLFDLDLQGQQDERQINALTAEFLIPQGKVRNLWEPKTDVFEQITELGRHFKVSRLAMTIKLANLGLVNREIVEKVRAESVRDFRKKAGSGGKTDFYRVYHSRISPTFLGAVIRSAESGGLSYTRAFNLLGVKGKTYDKIKEDVMSYE